MVLLVVVGGLCKVALLMMVLAKALEISLTALLAFFMQVEQGFQHMDRGEYAKAAEVLTHVIDSEYAQTPVGEYARLSRAEAYIKLKIPREAHPDLAWLIQHTENQAIRQQAMALFQQVEGNLDDFLPRESAAATADRAYIQLLDGAYDQLPAYFSGDLASTLAVTGMIFTEQSGGSNIYERLAEELRDGEIISVRTNEARQAEVVLQADSLYVLQMEPVAAAWKFTRLKGVSLDVASYQAFEMAKFPKEHHANIKRLRRLSRAVQVYREEHDRFPPQFEALAGYTKVHLDVFSWTHPITGEITPYLFRERVPADAQEDVIIMAAPVVFHGKREIVFADGRIDLMPEADFLKQAKGQQWLLPAVGAVERVGPSEQKEIEALIVHLRDGDFKQRRTAKKQLKEWGAVAYPILLQYQKSSDPELRMSINELLKPQ